MARKVDNRNVNRKTRTKKHKMDKQAKQSGQDVFTRMDSSRKRKAKSRANKAKKTAKMA